MLCIRALRIIFQSVHAIIAMEQTLCRMDIPLAPDADYVHCRTHALNLILNDAAKRVAKVLIFFDKLVKIYTSIC